MPQSAGSEHARVHGPPGAPATHGGVNPSAHNVVAIMYNKGDDHGTHEELQTPD
jgi:hypothetical protein